MSSWFRSHGYASVYDHLIVGAVPLDEPDVRVLATLGISRVLNLVEDGEYAGYGRGARRKVERALEKAAIEERRLSTVDYGGLTPELLEQSTAQVNSWLDDGQIVYLHCRAGGDLEAALTQVQQLKSNADPLPHQREDLEHWFEARERRL